ncbi:hypothetical protein DFQ28_006676 [Apophysomyces sp. BC1034]|nr:hypothetical protein DFQ30_006389 [Apophysomyces sp. BC1015]KAG0173506.1 hypothetical protein DFQ29_007913 [Apophysomyces sp. BC1021]KAG0187259.1 hypothetical protein DFQ28_006676 [Apophysomyces sp. BC1034]
MSTKLAKNSLNLLLKEKSSSKRKLVDEKPSGPPALPSTKNGLKKIKYEIRYGRHQKLKERRAEKQKKENPIDAMTRDEQALDENLKRNVKLLVTKLKASDVERKLRAQIMKHKNAEDKMASSGEESD